MERDDGWFSVFEELLEEEKEGKRWKKRKWYKKYKKYKKSKFCGVLAYWCVEHEQETVIRQKSLKN